MLTVLALDTLPGDVLAIIVLCMDLHSTLAFSMVSLLFTIDLGAITSRLSLRHAERFTTSSKAQ